MIEKGLEPSLREIAEKHEGLYSEDAKQELIKLLGEKNYNTLVKAMDFEGEYSIYAEENFGGYYDTFLSSGRLEEAVIYPDEDDEDGEEIDDYEEDDY